MHLTQLIKNVCEAYGQDVTVVALAEDCFEVTKPNGDVCDIYAEYPNCNEEYADLVFTIVRRAELEEIESYPTSEHCNENEIPF